MTPAELSNLRASLGLSQSQLSAKLDISKKTLQNWEQGVSKIPRIAVFAFKLLAGDSGLEAGSKPVALPLS